MALIPKNQLQVCDILLYKGEGVLSHLIRLFDGGSYSHTSIYLGNNEVLEAIDGGISRRTVDISVGSTHVDVFRFVSDSGQRIGPAPGNLSEVPVAARAAYYDQNRQRYAYEQLLLLAFLAATRRLPLVGWIPGLGLLLRSFLDPAAKLLAQIIAAGKEPMICSELVYRCYEEAGQPVYQIKIRGADILKAASLAAAPTLAQASAFNAGSSLAEAQVLREQQDVQMAAREFLSAYTLAKNANNPAGTVTALAVPDFVTPRDLEKSPNLILLGELQR
jgi:hypothetical protein